MRIEWVDGFMIRVSTENGEAVISANKEGSISLAKHLTALAEETPGAADLRMDASSHVESVVKRT